MIKKIYIFFIAIILLVSISGCATARKQKDLQIQGLRNKISVLEAQIQSKDEEINSLKEALARAGEERSTSQISRRKVKGEVKSRPSVKHIQKALKNAGYEPGPIDGKMGRRTKEAIKAFQRANNLAADGKVGKQTWRLLSNYLYQKVK